MNLTELAKKKATIPIRDIGDDVTLAKEVQARLNQLGCLDPPVDGDFGPVSMLALTGFAKHAGVPVTDALTGRLADALLSAQPATFLPLTLGHDFASRIVKTMLAKNYFVARLPGHLTIVYVEGCDADGKANHDDFDKWNDRRIVLDIMPGGKPRILFNALATSEPGAHYTKHPLNPKGAARIALEQRKAWRVGMHHPLSPPPRRHEALVQVKPLKIFRDRNKDGLRGGDAVFVGSNFGINQHSGHDQSLASIGTASAGCLVGRVDAEHKAFMKLVKTDPRFHGNNGYLYMTAVMLGNQLVSA